MPITKYFISDKTMNLSKFSCENKILELLLITFFANTNHSTQATQLTLRRSILAPERRLQELTRSHKSCEL